MAQIDQQAARKELKEAARLRARAEQLVEIADELEQQAECHEHDAMDLIAPADTSPVVVPPPSLSRPDVHDSPTSDKFASTGRVTTVSQPGRLHAVSFAESSLISYAAKYGRAAARIRFGSPSRLRHESDSYINVWN